MTEPVHSAAIEGPVRTSVPPSGSRPTVLIAPDSFKGTFSAEQVAGAVASGLQNVGLGVDHCPIADGGEGTLDALIGAGERHTVEVSDPLGRPISAEFGLRDGVAIVEMASASGLGLVARDERDPWRASTFGTGELIAAAISAGARTVHLGVGGSATTDGGAGATAAITASGGMRGTQLVVLCDVRVPYEEAARVFAAQKGADARQIVQLSKRLESQATAYPRDPRGVPGTGAAGGLAGGLWAMFGAELVGGAGFVLDQLGFDRRCAAAIAVVTGEGKLDGQTRTGKAVSEVAARARRCAVPCYAIVGTVGLDERSARNMGLTEVHRGRTLNEIRGSAALVGRTLLSASLD